ncbi:MAG: lysophospholipid acyltransferase family protein [Alphaproteobacteria bacterium GM202ARS2]|nr:lysophospholipid acyltransferase family protein [Alphaproteobacteria bacterium GM202ARS2]
MNTPSPRLPKGKRLRYLSEACALWLAFRLFRLLGLPASSALGGCLARLIGPLTPLSRIARQNLQAVFPDMPPRQRRHVISGMWNNIGRVIAEYPHLDQLRLYDTKGRYPHRVIVKNKARLEALCAADKPVVFVSAHYGNWEMSALCVTQLGYPLTVVYRPPNNPLVDSMLAPLRASLSTYFAPKNDTVGSKRLVKAMRNKEAIGFVADQRTITDFSIPFLGHASGTLDAPAKLALHFKAPLVPVMIERTRKSHFILTVEEPLPVPTHADTKKNIYDLTLSMHQRFEAWILSQPEQWLWIHNRWTFTLPPEKA